MEKLKSILNKYQWPIKTGQSKLIVKDIEVMAGLSMPTDYTVFLNEYQGYECFIGEEYLVLWGIDEIIEMNARYGIIDNLSNTLGIGSNGAGELIAIEISGTQYRIVLTPSIGLDKQYNIEIGSSFTDFFVRLDSGINWSTI